MKRYVIVGALIALSIYSFGCGKKKATMDETQELLSMDQMSTITSSTAPSVASTAADAAQAGVAKTVKNVEPTVAANVGPLPPSGPYKPSGMDIQTALKNAGFYTGAIDGKLGPMTKEAIEDFQKAKGLEADGKVGPKTWAAMAKYLAASATGAVKEALDSPSTIDN